MVNLPWDILLMDILVRLPLKSIARFRCVNHLLHDELKRTEFLRAHRRLASEMGKFNVMLRTRNFIDTFSVDTSLSTCGGFNHIEYPIESQERKIVVFGCCYGLVLFWHANKFNKCDLMLWNLTTDECKVIPSPPIGTKAKDRAYGEYALGYSAQIEDFKVVHLTQALQEGLFEVQVYTLKSNSWRRIDNVEIYDLYPCGISAVRWPVGGAAHWFAYVDASSKEQSLLRFEFESEEFDVMPLPDIFNRFQGPTVCALGRSLCYFVYDPEVTTVWELKNNMVEKSGTKLFTIELAKHFGSVYHFIPLKSLTDGKIVLGVKLDCTDLRIVVYDPKHDTVETLRVYESTVPATCISVYEESLHSLDTGVYLGQLQWEDEDAGGGDGDEEESKGSG